MPYIFDTNSIATLSHYYPKRFPSFWSLFDAAIEAEEVVSVREVLKELENHTFLQQWLDDWLDEHKPMFHIPSAKEMQFVVEIFKVKQFQALVGEKQRLRGSPVADPFVIACANVSDGTVVTQEVKKEGGSKIPNVCEHFKIKCTNLEDFSPRMVGSFKNLRIGEISRVAAICGAGSPQRPGHIIDDVTSHRRPTPLA